jgi:uncharacterized protein (TIGR03790 family)
MIFRFLIVVLVLASALNARAQSPANVAVVINDNSPESQKIGMTYAAARSIPDSNVFRIRTVTAETIDRAAFAQTIALPLAAALTRAGLQDRILYVVLTKGIPLRVNGTAGQNGTIASVDSELALLYRQMTGRLPAPAGRVDNPYFLGDQEITEARPFTHRDFDIFLVSRLDGYTVDEALALIERAASAKGGGKIVLDQRDALVNRTGETWMDLASKRLNAQGHCDLVVLETTPKPAREVSDVLGYFSWGSTDPQNRVRGSGMRFMPGAIAASFVGSDARTFHEPPAAWVPTGDLANRATWFEGSAESLIGDLIREGVTGVAGYVSQPFLNGTVRPQTLFPAYVAGFNLVEAFYLAIPYVSWQTIVIGDPLATAFPRKALARSEIEADIDPVTTLPGFFSKRRLAVATSSSPGIPERAVALRVRADTLAAKGDVAGARSAIQEAVALAPRFVAGLLLLAGFDETAGRRDQAISTYRRILEVEPDHAVALNNLAFAMAVHLKMPKDALPYAERAVAKAPGNPTVLDTLAWVQYLLGDHARAASTMATVVRSNIQNAEIRLHAAIVFAAAGERASAERELAVALKLEPALTQRSDVKELSASLSK